MSTATRQQTTTIKPSLIRRQHSSLSTSSRVYCSALNKKVITKSSNDVRIWAPVQYTKTDTKDDDDDDSRRVLIQPAAERVKLVQVEHLGGLKLRFRFSGNIHHRKSSGDAAAATGVKNCCGAAAGVKKRAAQETPERNHCVTAVVKKRAVEEITERNHCDTTIVKKPAVQETTEPNRCAAAIVKKPAPAVQETSEPNHHSWRSWWQSKIERERKAARVKNLAVQETTERKCRGTAAVVKQRAVEETPERNRCAAAGVKKRAVEETTERNCCATTIVKKCALQETTERNHHCWRSWRQKKIQREREAARRKIESMTKTVDIPNNYYNVMGKLDRMFGDREWVMEAFYGGRKEKPLEKLGLFLKD